MSGFEIPYLHKIPGIHKKYQPLLLFIIKVLGLFFLFLFLKFIHRLLIDPSGNSMVSSFLRELNIYALFADTIIYPANWMVNLLGYETVLAERTISIAGAQGVIIHGPCMGFNVFSIFIALIIAYPVRAKVSRKVLFIAGGILGIHLLNVLRVSSLVIKNNYSFNLGINHHDLFNVVIYAFVFILFYFWIRYNSKASVDVAEE